MRSDECLAALRRTAYIGDANAFVDWSDAILLSELNDKLNSVFGDMIVKARAGYWLKDRVVTLVAGKSRYRIPPRAVVGGLEKVEYSVGGAVWARLTELPASIEQDYRTTLSGRPAFYTVDGDVVDLMPAPTTGLMRLTFYIRPSRLVTSQSSTQGGAAAVRGLVTDINTVTRVLTVNTQPFDYSLTVPAAISGTLALDVVHPNGWHELSFWGDAQNTSTVGGTSVALGGTASMDDIEIGDFVRVSEQTDWPCIPGDFHRALADLAAVKVLIAMAMAEKSQSIAENVGNDLLRMRSLLLPRVKAEPKLIGLRPRSRGWFGTRPNIDASPPVAADVASCNNIMPVEIANLGGSQDYLLQKNWDFGTGGNIRNIGELDSEFFYHDNFNQISNGSGLYGTLTVASSVATRISDVSGLNPDGSGFQPVDPTGTTYRRFTPGSMIASVRALPGFTTVGPMTPSPTYHGGCGSIRSKFSLPAGGQYLGKTVVWETRCRMMGKTPPVSGGRRFPDGYWFALWTVGDSWDGGPEMDVVESYSDTFASGLYNGDAFHVNSVGGIDTRFLGGDPWWVGMNASGMPGIDQDGTQSLRNWHTFTWIYRPNDSYEVWIDGYKFQQGTLEWEVQQGGNTGVKPNMWFLFDFAALHSQIFPINTVTVPSGDLPIEYEIDYSRIWLRNS